MSLRRLATQSIVIIALVLSASVYASKPAVAADGDQLRQITADRGPAGSCSINTGIAFDGTNLLLSCWYDSNIVAVSPADGHFVAVHAITGVGGMGALAWDNGRHLLWACSLYSSVGTVNLVTNTFTPVFNSAGCTDGLAYDGSDDTIWSSADAASTTQHYTIAGVLLNSYSNSGLIGGCGNSGIAVGGNLLYLANNGCSQIYRVNKTFTTSTFFATFPRRLEDLECDNLTFAAQGKGAMWSIDAYDTILNAWEIPAGSCAFGGGDTTPPTCVLTAVLAGPPKQIQITVRDTGSGLASIVVTSSVNANTPVPAFTVGTTDPVVVTSTKINQTLAASVSLRVTDSAGNVTNCDPVITDVLRVNGADASQTFTVPRNESKIDVQNGSPGLKMIEVTVNGEKFQVKRLADGETATLDVASAMRDGNNTIVIRGNGPKGASATVVIHD